MTNEWVEWHQGYNGDHPQSRRLRLVQDQIRRALTESPPGAIRVISICAGDGRDLLGALSEHRRVGDVTARMVEITPELVEAGRGEIARLGLGAVETILGDASSTTAYAGAVPANLVLACGVFGNISDADVKNTISHLPELCAAGARVIWTRGTWAPDLTPTIRGWFRDSGFTEETFAAIPGTSASVGMHRLVATPPSFRAGTHLFTFLPKHERPSEKGRGAVGRSKE